MTTSSSLRNTTDLHKDFQLIPSLTGSRPIFTPRYPLIWCSRILGWRCRISDTPHYPRSQKVHDTWEEGDVVTGRCRACHGGSECRGGFGHPVRSDIAIASPRRVLSRLQQTGYMLCCARHGSSRSAGYPLTFGLQPVLIPPRPLPQPPFVPFTIPSSSSSNLTLYHVPDDEIDFATFLKQPLPPGLANSAGVKWKAHWLAVEGVQPAIAENPPPKATAGRECILWNRAASEY